MRGVAVVGSLASDVVAGDAPRVGGAPFYAAAALRLLGRPSLVVTRCAERDRSTLLPPLVAQGAPVEWHPSERTFRFRFSYDGGRADDDARGGGRAVAAGAVARRPPPAATPSTWARWRRASSRRRRSRRSRAGAGSRSTARASSAPPTSGPLRLEPLEDRSLLRHVSILKLAEEEAAVLAGGTDPDALAALGVPEVCSPAARPARSSSPRPERTRFPRCPCPSADPTGAGDAFSVAYLVSRTAGLGPASAARRATAIVAEMLVRRRRR